MVNFKRCLRLRHRDRSSDKAMRSTDMYGVCTQSLNGIPCHAVVCPGTYAMKVISLHSLVTLDFGLALGPLYYLFPSVLGSSRYSRRVKALVTAATGDRRSPVNYEGPVQGYHRPISWPRGRFVAPAAPASAPRAEATFVPPDCSQTVVQLRTHHLFVVTAVPPECGFVVPSGPC